MLLLIIAYPFLVHWAVLGGGALVWWAALMIPALVALLSPLRRRAPWAWAGVAAAAALAWWLVRAGVAPYLLYLPPILINLMLLAIFARGLGGPGPSLVTRMAEIMHGEALPDEVAAYTHRVTWAWVILFAVMTTANLLLALLAPREIWSLFANFINYLIVGLLFGVEYAIRRQRFPDYDHPGFFTFLRRLARIDYRRLGAASAARESKTRPAGAESAESDRQSLS